MLTKKHQLSNSLMDDVDRLRAGGATVAEACAAIGANERSYYRRLFRSVSAKPSDTTCDKQGQSQSQAVCKSNPDKRSDAAADRIVEAAIESFSTYGYRATTNRYIAKAAGVSHGLVRYHFRTKRELWLVAVEQNLNEYYLSLHQRLSSIPHRSAGPAGKLAVVIEEIIRFMARHPTVPHMLGREPLGGSDHQKTAVETHIRRHYELVKGMIVEGQKDGSVRAGDPDHIYYLIISSSFIYMSSFEYNVLTGKNAFAPQEIEKRIALVIDMLTVR